MNLRPIIDENPHSVESRLLRVGREMQPPPSTLQKTLAGLGLGASTLGIAQVAHAATATCKAASTVTVASGPLASTATTAGASKVAASTIAAGKSTWWAILTTTGMKGVAIGVVAGASAFGAAQLSGSKMAADSPTLAASSGRVTRAPGSSNQRASPRAEGSRLEDPSAKNASELERDRAEREPAGTERTAGLADARRGEPERQVSAETAPHDESALARFARAPAIVIGAERAGATLRGSSLGPIERSTAGDEAQKGRLGAEVTSIDAIRDALAAGQSEVALKLLDEHDRTFVPARLKQEATFLRAKALELAGRRLDANRTIEQLQRDYPDSTLLESR